MIPRPAGGFVRSVLHFPHCSSSDRKLVLPSSHQAEAHKNAFDDYKGSDKCPNKEP